MTQLTNDDHVTINALRHSLEVKNKRVAELEQTVAELEAFLAAYRKENKAIREVVAELTSDLN